MLFTRFEEAASVADEMVSFAAALVKHSDEWLLYRAEKDTAWRMPVIRLRGGESIETALRTALSKTVGAVLSSITPALACEISENGECYYGKLYVAEAELVEPQAASAAEVRTFSILPSELAYPELYSELYERVQCWLNLQNSADELWDVYDINRRPTGKLHRRGELLAEGEYHLVVHVWTRNSRGEFLLTQRSAQKGFPYFWETTGGSAVAGDDSISAALREVSEETGVVLQRERGRLIHSYNKRDYFCDVWLFGHEFELDKVVLQPSETRDAMSADIEKLEELYREGRMFPYDYFDKFLQMAKNGKLDM